MNANPSTTSPATDYVPTPRDQSEDEFLRLRAEQTQASLSQSVEALKKSLGTAADLHLWAQHHPWLTVGAAAAAGFAAGSVLVGRPASTPPPQKVAAAATSNASNSPVWSLMLGPLFELAKIALQSTLAGAMAGATQAQAAEANSAPQESVAVPPPLPEL